MKLSRIAALAAGIGVSISTFNVAQASFVLQISDPGVSGALVFLADGLGVGGTTDGGYTTTVADSSLIPDGVISFNGSIGSWTVNVTTGVSDPQIGPGQLDLNSINVSGGTGTLDILLTDTDYTGPVPAYTADYGGTTMGSVFFLFGYGASNGEFTSTVFTPPFTVSGGAFSGSATGAVTQNDPYSLTISTSITHTAAGQSTSFNVQLAPVPIPPTVWLFGSGLLGLIGISRRKKAA